MVNKDFSLVHLRFGATSFLFSRLLQRFDDSIKYHQIPVSQSGEFEGTKQHISKRGSPYLRRAIWLAANRAAFCDPILLEYYQSLNARGKHHLTAVGAVARKMCNIIFTILRKNRPYETTPLKTKTLIWRIFNAK